jgi:hypothetical protein
MILIAQCSCACADKCARLAKRTHSARQHQRGGHGQRQWSLLQTVPQRGWPLRSLRQQRLRPHSRRHQRPLDVFIRDMQTQQTTRVRLNGAGGAGQSDGDSYVAAMSADGRFIARTPLQIFSSGICRLTRRVSSASTRGHLLSPPAK